MKMTDTAHPSLVVHSSPRFCHGLALFALVASTFGLAGTAQAQTDMPIYTDGSLASSWQNWSWATVNVDSTAVLYSDGTDTISVAAGPWQSLWLEHAAFSTAGYGNLTFWINGGINGGQQLSVVSTENGSYQQGVSHRAPHGRHVATRSTVPLSALAVANVTDFTGFWVQEGAGIDQSQNPSTSPTWCSLGPPQFFLRRRLTVAWRSTTATSSTDGPTGAGRRSMPAMPRLCTRGRARLRLRLDPGAPYIWSTGTLTRRAREPHLLDQWRQHGRASP